MSSTLIGFLRPRLGWSTDYPQRRGKVTQFLLAILTLFLMTLTSWKYFSFHTWALTDLLINEHIYSEIFPSCVHWNRVRFCLLRPCSTRRGSAAHLRPEGHQRYIPASGCLVPQQQGHPKLLFPLVHLSFLPSVEEYEIMFEKSLVPFGERCTVHLLYPHPLAKVS